jgi:hypothetical protein
MEMKKAQDLLELARQKCPEQQDDVHGICLSDNGKLVLVLSTQTGHQAFHFEDSDLDRSPEDILAAIDALLQGKPS